ncbi:hypothetical protein EAE90_05465 [Photorhabdus caribbeanensis]|nr:hypothetical protein [Photorhabdus caribbeanensis]
MSCFHDEPNCLTVIMDVFFSALFRYIRVPCYHLFIIPVIFQAASLLAALTHPGNIVCYAPGDSLPCRRDPS